MGGTLVVSMPAHAQAAPSEAAPSQAASKAAGGPLVRVKQGWLRGTSGAGVEAFLGIPYAKPPIAELRWRPPVPPASWHGVRDAQNHPSRCAQIGNEGPGSEDCLYLNVYRPSHVRRNARLPVLFYLHGGSSKVGSAIDNDPSRIAASTETLVVMINYRLGPFGFMAHPALSAETSDGSSGEYGLMDQQAALRWVHEQISAFGGDPHNITIAGGSAGGLSVCAHMTSPDVAGLFSGAVIQSGACAARTLNEAHAQGLEFATAAGCTDATSSACLRQKTTAELLASDSWAFPHLPIWGARLLPQNPPESIRAGTFTHVPVLIGGVHDEVRAGLAGEYPMSEEEYRELVSNIFGDNAEAVLQVYPSSARADPFSAFAAAINDSGLGGIGSCRTLRLTQDLAAHVPTYAYEFDDQTAPTPTWVALPAGLVLGASHGSDEAYWFDRPFDSIEPLQGPQITLAQQMIQYLGAFVERKAPRVRRQPFWPLFQSDAPRVISFRPEQPIVRSDLLEAHHCEFWASIGF